MRKKGMKEGRRKRKKERKMKRDYLKDSLHKARTTNDIPYKEKYQNEYSKYLGVVDVNLTAVRLRKGKWGGEFSRCMYMSKCVNDTVRTANSVLHDLVIIHPFY